MELQLQKGKSTTASLLYYIFRGAGEKAELIGNIGNPALLALGTDRKEKIYIFELSSYQLADFQGELDAALLLNLFPEHLNYHGSLEEYYRAKLSILSKIKDTGFVVYNPDYPEIKAAAKEYDIDKVPFPSKVNYVDAHKSIVIDGKFFMNEKEIPLFGEHNCLNILAAVLTAKKWGISEKEIKESVIDFKPLPHRLEVIGNYSDIVFVDDAISTTPESTIAALRALPYRVGTLILGGLDRGYSFHKLAKEILTHPVDNVILFPDSGKTIWKAICDMHELLSETKLPNHYYADNMIDCVNKAYNMTPPKTACLLSTASPSYSIFKNFEDKGDQFKSAVTNYK